MKTKKIVNFFFNVAKKARSVASMQIPSRIYIDSRGNLHGRRGNLHGRRGEFAWTQVGICMDARGEFAWKEHI